MRALVLGGAGAVCKETTRDLAAFSKFDEVVIADYNIKAAEKLISSIGDQRLKAIFFNAEDYESMLKIFPGFDVVVNGLPWKFDMPVTQACVEAGVNGLDVSTEEDQWDLDEGAKTKNLVFIPGVGATPGITNVMARRGADLMDEVDDIQINFAAFRSPAPAPGLLITFLWEFHPITESRVYYKDGEFHWVGPFEGAKIVHFPGPIGDQEVYYIPHPETRTMPKSLGAKAVSVRGCFPPHAIRLAKAMLESGLYSEEPVKIKGLDTTAHELMHEILLTSEETKQTPLWAYGLVVDMFGKLDDHDIAVKLWNRHPPMEEWGGESAYYTNIGIPLSIGAEMIARGDVKSKGVIPPEIALDPDIFIAEMRRRGMRLYEQVIHTREVGS